MTNPSKAKGTAAETAIVNYLRELGVDAHRHALHGTQDVGDILIPGSGVVIEVKAHRDMALAAWVDECETERQNAAARWPGSRVALGIVWHKRRGKGDPRDCYCTLPGWQMVELLKESGRL